MKKLILILTLAAFACSPMMVPTAQAAPNHHSASAKGKKHHKKHKSKKGKKHHKKG